VSELSQSSENYVIYILGIRTVIEHNDLARPIYVAIIYLVQFRP